MIQVAYVVLAAKVDKNWQGQLFCIFIFMSFSGRSPYKKG